MNPVLWADVRQFGAVAVEAVGFDIAFETALAALQIRFVFSRF